MRRRSAIHRSVQPVQYILIAGVEWFGELVTSGDRAGTVEQGQRHEQQRRSLYSSQERQEIHGGNAQVIQPNVEKINYLKSLFCPAVPTSVRLVT